MIKVQLSGSNLPTIQFCVFPSTPIKEVLTQEAIYQRYRSCGFPVAPSTIKRVEVLTWLI